MIEGKRLWMVSALLANGLLVSACSEGAREADAQGNAGSADVPKGAKLLSSALERVSAPSRDNLSALSASNNAFAFDLLHQLAKDKPEDNLVFSPVSISTALAMTYAGAEGETASELKETLHFELEQPALHEAFNALDLALASRGKDKAGADGTPFRLYVNNSLWTRPSLAIVPGYLDTLALHYGAGIYQTDFGGDPEGSRAAINAWVADRTEQLIPALLPPKSIRGDTVLVLTNTVYFNASWLEKFVPEQTRDAPFHGLDGATKDVPTMRERLARVGYRKGADYEAVALPYADDQLAFVAVLPDEGAYAKVEAAADGPWFGELLAGLEDTSAEVLLPKLDITTHVSLKDTLRALGLNKPFDDADFSGLTPGSLSLSDVIHQSVLKLLEGGTIAAAATAVVGTKSGKLPSAHTVTFDRPFLYAVVDRGTGQVLFVGRVLDPSAP